MAEVAKTILLEVNDVQNNIRPTFEAIAAVAVTPGHFGKLDANGKVAFIATGDRWPGVLVVENEYVAEGSTPGIDTAYAIGARTQFARPMSGDLVNALLGTGTVAVGDLVEVANDGTVAGGLSTSVLAVGVAEAAGDATGGAVRVPIRLI